MENLNTYLYWRGDLPLKDQPFGAADSLVLSQLSNYDFSGLIPGPGAGSVELGFILGKMMGQPLWKQLSKEDQAFLRALADSPRFAKLPVSDYMSAANGANGFAALTIQLPDGSDFVSFQGSGPRLAGLEESFLMGVQERPAQNLAAGYLEAIVDPRRRYRLGGQGQGGNMAQFAALKLPAAQQDAILEIFAEDAPGFSQAMKEELHYERIARRIHRLVSSEGLSGLVFEADSPRAVVASAGPGLASEDLLLYQTSKDKLKGSKLSPDSELSATLLNEALSTRSEAAQVAFIKDLFRLFKEEGIEEPSELSPEEVQVCTIALARGEKVEKVRTRQWLASARQSLHCEKFSSLLKQKDIVTGLLYFAAGLLFMLVPNTTGTLLGFVLAAGALLYIGQKELEEAFNTTLPASRRKLRIVLCMTLMCILMFLLSQQTVLAGASVFVVAAFFLITSFMQMDAAMKNQLGSLPNITGILIALIAFLLGMAPVFGLDAIVQNYVYTAGLFLLIRGLWEIISALYKTGRSSYVEQSAAGGRLLKPRERNNPLVHAEPVSAPKEAVASAPADEEPASKTIDYLKPVAADDLYEHAEDEPSHPQ